jgi:hypothetical protein
MANLSVCGTDGANTGLVLCAPSPGKAMQLAIFAGALLPVDYATDLAVKNKLVGYSKLSKKDSSKLFILPLNQDKENKKENNTEQTFTNGLKIVTREGLSAYRFSYFTTLSQNQALRKFNGSQVRVLVQDDANLVWGTTQEASNGTKNFVGRKATLFFEGLDFVGDDKVSGVGYVEVTFLSASESYDDSAYVNPGVSLESAAQALLDVQLFEKVASATNTKKISGLVPTGKLGGDKDIYEDFSITLGVLTNFYAKNLTTGASIAITSVTPNAAGYWDIVIDSAAYTALTVGTKVEIGCIAPNLLDAANVVGIEVLPVVITK